MQSRARLVVVAAFTVALVAGGGAAAASMRPSTPWPVEATTSPAPTDLPTTEVPTPTSTDPTPTTTTSSNATKPADDELTKEQKEILAQYEAWHRTLVKDADPAKMADRYAPDAILRPTKSGPARTDRDAIIAYFTEFLKSRPYATIVTSEPNKIYILGPDSAMHTGVYEFELTIDGKVQKVRARFMFLYKKIDGKWKIVEHQSTPEPSK